MVNSRDKGKRGERQARDAAKRHWFAGDDCIRAAQSNGKFSQDLLNALPWFHVEVKWYEKIGCLKWLRRALLDSKGAPAVVMMRENSSPEFYVLMRIEDSHAFASAIWAAKTNKILAPLPEREVRSASDTTPATSVDRRTTSPSTPTGTPTASPADAEITLDRMLTLPCRPTEDVSEYLRGC